MAQLEDLTKTIVAFRDAREWRQFHNPKDMAISLALEAAELMELFQWKTDKQLSHWTKTQKSRIGEELADVLYWILLMSHDLKIDIAASLRSKMKQNADKYPVEKSRGRSTKYTDL